MKWSVTIPGAPPSVNHSYRPIMVHKKDSFGRPLFSASGKAVTRIGMAKQSAVTDYQTAVVRIAQSARPSGWPASGPWIRVMYQFFLRRSIDCDNAMKALNDALAMAIGVNDEIFLPCALSKSIDSKEKNPRVVVTLDDLSDSPSSTTI